MANTRTCASLLTLDPILRQVGFHLMAQVVGGWGGTFVDRGKWNGGRECARSAPHSQAQVMDGKGWWKGGKIFLGGVERRDEQWWQCTPNPNPNPWAAQICASLIGQANKADWGVIESKGKNIPLLQGNGQQPPILCSKQPRLCSLIVPAQY